MIAGFAYANFTEFKRSKYVLASFIRKPVDVAPVSTLNYATIPDVMYDCYLHFAIFFFKCSSLNAAMISRFCVCE